MDTTENTEITLKWSDNVISVSSIIKMYKKILLFLSPLLFNLRITCIVLMMKRQLVTQSIAFSAPASLTQKLVSLWATKVYTENPLHLHCCFGTIYAFAYIVTSALVSFWRCLFEGIRVTANKSQVKSKVKRFMHVRVLKRFNYGNFKLKITTLKQVFSPPRIKQLWN